ncbi:double-strand break repair protein AddB [Phreatobacter stygius]|uniref:Double-strand break repair protein AddB n=1 Tax=Phreatobacter stygius TaxID=1940610 RepID=A0A4D7B9Z2_9HYPH|nr:double-strand break repair protein AddB [Phreatobacter stygius]QCI64872.1 double-strand break repair protein AddB [Phreatobacter stygius]
MPSNPHVLTIPASRPHLATLARAVLDGRVIAGWPDRSDPLSLAAGTILLPNRRACRAMHDAFLAVASDQAMLLPRIAPIGDIDEDEWDFADPDPLDTLGIDAIGPAMASLDRRLTLAGLVRAWAASVDRAVMKLSAADPLIVSTSTGDALALAADLMRLMDQVETERVPWSNLDRIVETGLDTFWTMTRSFLGIATEAWPAHLAANGLEEPAVRRDRLIAAETIRLAASPGPIIAAGSTGSILATRDLLKAIAHHPKGALILPGLDRGLDAASWEAIGGTNGPASQVPTSHGHPQFGLKRLIEHVGVTRDAVGDLAGADGHGRETLLSEAMRPAATTELWGAGIHAPTEAMLDGLTVVEAANERDEALGVALVLREIAEDPKATAALVTPDRALARRVLAELSRWNVTVDDSGGRPLAGTPVAAVARLVAALVFDDPAPATLLALIAHPALDHGLDPGRRDQAIAAIELTTLRGLRPSGGLDGYLAKLDKVMPSASPRPADAASRVSAEALADGRALLGRIVAALAPLMALNQASETPLAAFAASHGAVLDALHLDAEAQGGEEIASVLAKASGATAASFALPPGDYCSVFDALIATETVRVPARPGARIRVLGLPEARLLDAGTVVLAGLVEGSWPGEAKLDPWLNRAMRTAFGIDPPERRIGLAAHDFCQLLGNRRVVLTRAAKSGGVPTVRSRWLQRLAAVLGDDVWQSLVAKGETVLALAQRLDRPAVIRPVARPAPAPPLELRPARLPVTAIETWLRDPYAIYAQHVLKLSALDNLDEVPGAAERGTVIHGVLAAFTQEVQAKGFAADPVGRLVALGRDHFAPYWDDPSVRAIWWPRFLRIAQWFAAEDQSRRADLIDVHAEIKGRLEWETPAGRRFVLTTSADRIDIRKDGMAEIVDYKTGQPPSANQVQSGLAPQLALEAAVLKAGGFFGVPADTPIGALVYAKLGGRDPAGEFLPVRMADKSADELVVETITRLRELVAAFENPAQGYLSWAIPQFVGGRSNDYAHLARVKEWSAAGGGGDGE